MEQASTPIAYPFSAVVGSRQLKLALILCAISPAIGGVLIRGEKGTAKSTIVRGLGPLLGTPDRPRPVVELPIGATEDRVVGSIDVTRALRDGEAVFTPGLLARAHHGVLYIDEVNLLADHLVDVLLDAAASGRVTVERDGMSHTSDADFVLVGTMNPEEGELRPQLLDRFGLAVDVAATRDVDERVEVVTRRLEFDADPASFAARFAGEQAQLTRRIHTAREAIGRVRLPTAELRRIAAICAHLDVDGMRGDIVVTRAAAAHAAWRSAGAAGATEVGADDVRVAVELALGHRRRRDPFDESGLSEQQLDEAMAAGDAAADDTDPEPPDPDGPDPDGPGPDGPDPDGPDPDEGPGETSDGSHSGIAGSGGDDQGADDQGADDQRADDQAPSGAPDSSGASDSSGAPDDAGSGPENDATGQRFGAPAGASARIRDLTVAGIGGGASGRRSKAVSSRGMTTRAVEFESGRAVHVVGTALAAIERSLATTKPVAVTGSDLRGAHRIGTEGNLVVFLLDLSGSMTARRRLDAVTRACVDLLRDSYTRRDRVAVVVARGDRAHTVVPPTRSVDLAVARLSQIRVGGRTPLAEGLAEALSVITAAAMREPSRRPLLVALTDGRATAGAGAPERAASMAATIAARRVDAVVIDCEQGMIRLGLAAQLARHLRAPCVAMTDLTRSGIVAAVRAAA